jgi:hypothetical protein
MQSGGGWIEPILVDQGVKWDAADISLLERALRGTSETYRNDVLLALLNTGYRPTEETFMLVALFGQMKDVASTVPASLASSKVEFDALLDRVVDSVASQKESFDGFALAVQRIMESVGERLKEQAGNLATDYLSAAIAAKDAELRKNITTTIGDVTRNALKTAFTENKELLEQIKSSAGGLSTAAASPAGAKSVGVFTPVRFVAKGGIGVNQKAVLPMAIAAAIALFAGVEFGHAYPKPEVASSANYGRAVYAERRQMPVDLKAWLDSHVHR